MPEYFQKDGNGTADFSQASVVEISSNTTEVDLTSVNFTLSAGSVSQINLRVLDKNTRNLPICMV